MFCSCFIHEATKIQHLFLTITFSSLKQCTVYADLPSFLSPILITGNSFHPDLLLLIDAKILYILELTIGFETNIQNNSDRKAAKYSSLINDLYLVVKLCSSISLWVLLGLWVLPAIFFYPYYMNCILIRKMTKEL